VLSNPQAPNLLFSELANLFFASPSRDYGGLVRALAERDLFRVLAKPNLVTESGTEASFLAGGEFPYPVSQGGAVAGAITVEFKPFGVGVIFLPVVLDDGTINLRVEPEISTLDFANSVVSAGFEVPTIRKNTAFTTVNLRDGESFAIELLFLVTVKLVKPFPPGSPATPDPTELLELRPEEKEEFTLVPGIPGVGEVVKHPLGTSNLNRQDR
jgi:Flp pilus assembly secretin CpaC